MIEEELSKIWKSSPHQEQVKFDKSRFMLDVQSSVDDFHKQMRALFIREALGAFIAIPLFIFYAFLVPHLLTKIGFVLVALWAGYILWVIKRSKEKVPSQYAVSYLEYLEKTKEYLEESKRDRETILLWYVLPLVAFIWLAMLGFYLGDPDTLNGLIVTIIVSLVVSSGIYFLNLRSAKKVVAPKLDKVNKLIKALQE